MTEFRQIGGGTEEIGIGRPVAGEWLEEVNDVFHSMAPNGVTLKMRSNPGINYVSQLEMDGLGEDCTPETRIARIGMLLDMLVEHEQLEATALSETVTLTSHDNNFDLRPNGNYRFRVRPRDRRTSAGVYPEGFVISGEKAAVRQSVGLAYKQPSLAGGAPRHLLKIGMVQGRSGLFTPEIRREVRASIPKRIPLLPVGPISL